jgi:putative nucleotidyltransferase with HDIG domain
MPVQSGEPNLIAPLNITKKMLQSLAPLPATAVQLLALLDNPHTTLRQMAEVASKDVGIAAAILRMANSAILGMRGRVGTISDALRLIGTSQARLIVLTCGVAQMGQKELRFYGLASGTFMRHSELVATLTMTIAREVNYGDIGVAYSAGLLHDIGKVIINGLALDAGPSSPQSLQFLDAIRNPVAPMIEIEQDCFGTDHPNVGRDLSAHWALPLEIGDAIWLHHSSTDAGVPTLASFVALANATAGEVDPNYPAAHRAPMPMNPIVPIEPLVSLAQDLLKHD